MVGVNNKPINDILRCNKFALEAMISNNKRMPFREADFEPVISNQACIFDITSLWAFSFYNYREFSLNFPICSIN